MQNTLNKIKSSKKLHLVMLAVWAVVGITELIINSEVRSVFVWMIKSLLMIWGLSIAVALWLLWFYAVKHIVTKISSRR